MIHILPILLFSFSTSLSPGPNNLMIMNSGINFGIKNSLPHYLGVAFGFSAMMLIVALGFGELFTTHLWIQEALKIAGAAYMLYLAWKIAHNTSVMKTKSKKKPLSFLQAVLFQWVNPKAWTMSIGAIAIFTAASMSPITNAALLSFIFLMTALICGITWLLFGHFLQTFLKDDQHKKIFNYLMAAALLLSIALIFFE